MSRKTQLKKRVRVTQIVLLSVVLTAFLAACEQPGGKLPEKDRELDGNAALKSLSVNTGTLRPSFAADSENYTLGLRDTVTSITITAECASAKATVSGAGDISLDTDEKAVSVTVTAENGNTKSYAITVTRSPPPALDITSAEDLKKIGVDDSFPLDAQYTLAADISLTMDENWAGIASGPGEVFSGTFDGGGKTITLAGLKASGNTVSQGGDNILAGLFCRIGGGEGARASVKNLTIATATAVAMIAASDSHLSAGIIAGYAQAADFENITVTGNVSVTNTNKRIYLGGIAGTADTCAIINCVNEAEIYGLGSAAGGTYNQVGGIAGMFRGGTVITNCRNTGNIRGETSGANIFAGGIAGGSNFGYNTVSLGRIEGCSSSGNISASGGSMWAFAGGIAGVITGAGAEEPTSVVRSHASGNVSVGDSGFHYVGGIVGYNYFGALISQCYFTDGTVTSKGSRDYTGGIAGYNSQSSSGRASLIEDCWSGGTVQGYGNSGGIVGQNQEKAEIRRCYSTAAVSVINASVGAGGIAGLNVNTVANCAALNPSLEASPSVFGGNRIHRVTGDGRGSGNYAREDMRVTAGGIDTPVTAGLNNADGADCDKEPSMSFYKDTLAWDFNNIWQMETGDVYPKLQWQRD